MTYPRPSIPDKDSYTAIPTVPLTKKVPIRHATSKAHATSYSRPSLHDEGGHAVVPTAPLSNAATNQHAPVEPFEPEVRTSSPLNNVSSTLKMSSHISRKLPTEMPEKVPTPVSVLPGNSENASPTSNLETVDFSEVEMTVQNNQADLPLYGPQAATITPTTLIKPTVFVNRQSVTASRPKERTSSPSYNVSSTLKISSHISRKFPAEMPEEVPTPVSISQGNSENASPTSNLETVDFSEVEMTAQNGQADLPSYGPQATTIAPISLMQPNLSVTTIVPTSEQVPNANTPGTRQNVTTSVPPPTRKTKVPTNTPSKSPKTTLTYQRVTTTEVISSLVTAAVLNSTMMHDEPFTSSTSSYRRITDHASTTADGEHGPISPEKSWFQNWKIYVVALIIAIISLMCLCYILKRKYAHYGQYKVVTKPIWVSSSPGALEIKELHL
ncbi:hypothetical protein HOLleu_38892 [Holothuria leucospilota]|uniref:Uncharacterized protein n=1 Tax=Holothuria leucospilota TaxID=206669 RepID=A0A9Q1BDQ5_HOLLE|nr:hypothetical protein HOLleu_38892 [Holothuria leucospilota]